MRMQYTSNRIHIEEVYKRYLLRTFDGFLIRGSRYEKIKQIIFVRLLPLPLRMRMQYTSNRIHIEEVYKRYLLRTFDRMLYGFSICYWIHIMLLISHRHVTG